MKLDDVQPPHCHALARRLHAQARSIREELGRAEDTRPLPEVTGAEPREVYFEALAAWRKAARLATELGVDARPAPAAPPIGDLRPGHVLQVLESVAGTLDAVRQRLAIPEQVPEQAVEANRQPSDVLVAVIRVNRELSRALERPFTPADVFGVVALASAYAARLGGSATPAAFERRHQPAHCYARLEACLQLAAGLVAKKGGKALIARGAPPEVVPGDVYDLANLVLGEVAYAHALTGSAAPVHAFEPAPAGYRTPSHVHQLASTLEAQLAALA